MGRPPLPPEKRKPRLSGAQRRKLAYEREEREYGAKQPRRAQAHAQEGDNGAATFAALGPPPEDVATALSWGRRVQLKALHLAICDPSIPLPAKLRAVKDLSFVLGATHSRSALEERLAAVEATLGESHGHGAVEVKPTVGTSRPPTARGGSRGRGPVPVEPPPPDHNPPRGAA